MNQKASIPKGTRDFSSEVMLKRNYVLKCIQSAFQRFGFMPIETPAMENLDTLMGKYGEEGDRLIFKILNSGDYLSKASLVGETTSKSLTRQISEKALRYDLTVPFARFVAQNRNDITFPFKRYQIQPVWRADRPQKGRFREFYQCDADVVGSDSLLYEVELVQLCDEVFALLGLQDYSICINNRKVLSGIAEIVCESEKLIDITVALDKLDKIGVEKVQEEMRTKGVSDEAITKMTPLFDLSGNNTKKLEKLELFLSDSKVGMKGIEELRFVFNMLSEIGLRKAKLELDVTLARGLNYYTGAIFEVKTNEMQMGSIGGGGRYDDLTSMFGLKDVSGVGISFGLDRICLVLEELNLFPDLLEASTQLMFVNFGGQEAAYCMKLLKQLREAGVNAEIYPTASKMKKQMNYADKKSIQYVVLVGEDEMLSGNLTVKNMNNGTQQSLTIQDLLILLK
ncbi:MAG: histidine--tRNA ligase [Flavobacteriales bacterium]|nr:histidine--tRNA ligase [Flavobacteriales bacterium]|tara:strand:+ start:26650 stop:28011 length:1362 start_codon:yes stop_codon:yes gene_type:complete